MALIGTACWGHGYCTEAVRAVLGCGFDSLGLNRIFADHLLGNQASGRVLRKAGMSYKGRRRPHIRKWGKFIDLGAYAVLRSDWQTELVAAE